MVVGQNETASTQIEGSFDQGAEGDLYLPRQPDREPLGGNQAIRAVEENPQQALVDVMAQRAAQKFDKVRTGGIERPTLQYLESPIVGELSRSGNGVSQILPWGQSLSERFA